MPPRSGQQERQSVLFALSDAQGGYFTAQQALNLGFSYPNQHHHKTSGAWLPAGHGLYRLRDYPITEHEQLARLTLWSRDRQGTTPAVVSHETALALHGVSDILPAEVHLTVPLGFRKPAPAGVILHRATVPPGDAEERHGFNLTSLPRTLVDLLRPDFPSEHLLRALQVAVTEGRLSNTDAKRVRCLIELTYEHVLQGKPV